MIHIISFGYLHGEAPEADFTIDARRLFRDPHVDPRFRELTGVHHLVVKKVLDTPGVRGTIANTVALIHILAACCEGDITIAIGCAGGRHRSVVMANAIFHEIDRIHPNLTISHRDIAKPVVART